MRTETIKVFSFAELKPEVHQKVINKYRSINTESGDWYESIVEGIIETFNEIGFEVKFDDITFDIYHNEAGIKATIDITTFVKAKKLPFNVSECRFFVTSNHHDSCHVNYENYNEDDNTLEELCQLMEDELQRILKEFVMHLRNYYEELESDESIKETLEINDFEFIENGNRWL